MGQSLVLLISGWYLEGPVFRQCVYTVEESGIVLPSARIFSESLPDVGICLAFCGIAEYYLKVAESAVFGSNAVGLISFFG